MFSHFQSHERMIFPLPVHSPDGLDRVRGPSISSAAYLLGCHQGTESVVEQPGQEPVLTWEAGVATAGITSCGATLVPSFCSLNIDLLGHKMS